MFEILPNPSLDLMLMVGRAALLVGAFWIFALAFIRWRRADEAQAQRLHAQLERAFTELRSLHETVTVMNARIEALSERTESEVRLAPAPMSPQRGYEVAVRLAKNGAGVEELIASCGITRHEAELLTRLHGSKPREAHSFAWQMRQPAAQVDSPTPASRSVPASRKRGSLLSVVS